MLIGTGKPWGMWEWERSPLPWNLVDTSHQSKARIPGPSLAAQDCPFLAITLQSPRAHGREGHVPTPTPGQPRGPHIYVVRLQFHRRCLWSRQRLLHLGVLGNPLRQPKATKLAHGVRVVAMNCCSPMRSPGLTQAALFSVLCLRRGHTHALRCV